MPKNPSISWKGLPDTSKVSRDLVESSFFKPPGRKLPTPAHVKSLDTTKQGILMFPGMQLVVKFGPRVTVEEAVTMWAITKLFEYQIPVLELFGWRSFQNEVFIYMELIQGVTMKQLWSDPGLSDPDRLSLCKQLRQMISSLRQLQHESGDMFIGSITRGPLLDRVFYDRPKAGPFANLKEFYSWLEWLPQRFLKPSQGYKDPYLHLMPKDSTIKFTHADLHPTNVMVSASGPPRVLALIDWGQSGWYPDYWEYVKMSYTMWSESEWFKKWVPKILEPRDDEILS